MAFFRTVGFAETSPSIDGEGVTLRLPQMADFEEWAALRDGEPRFPDAVGAVLAGRRSHPRRLPPPAQALRRGLADRPVLRVLRLSQAGQRAGRRSDARQHPPRRRPGRQHRLLDGGAVRALRPHDRGGQGVLPFSFGTLRLHRVEAACIPTNTPSIRLLERCGFRARGLCAPVSVHQRHLAGSPAVCAPQGRCAIRPCSRHADGTRRPAPQPWVCHGWAGISRTGKNGRNDAVGESIKGGRSRGGMATGRAPVGLLVIREPARLEARRRPARRRVVLLQLHRPVQQYSCWERRRQTSRRAAGRRRPTSTARRSRSARARRPSRSRRRTTDRTHCRCASRQISCRRRVNARCAAET